MSVSAFPQGTVAVAASAASGETVSLSGTTGSPVTATNVTSNPTNAQALWCFCDTTAAGNLTKGYSQKRQGTGNYTSVNTSTDWVLPHDFAESYWIRVTVYSGDTPNVGTLNAWVAMSGNPAFGNLTSSIQSLDSVMKVEISTGSSGSPIVATGYYRATATRAP